MADNYLEKRYEEVFGNGAKKGNHRPTPSLDYLLANNRSQRGYVKSRIVTREELEKIVGVNCYIPSARNQQALRFRLVTHDTGANVVLRNIRLGGALPQLHLPFEGTEPEAFIIVCTTQPESKFLDMDAGISMQSMLLKAVSMGLNGIIICAFNKKEITEAFALPYEPIAVVAIGKGAERIQLVPINEGESQTYYRKDGTHFVPKIKKEDLIIP